MQNARMKSCLLFLIVFFVAAALPRASSESENDLTRDNFTQTTGSATDNENFTLSSMQLEGSTGEIQEVSRRIQEDESIPQDFTETPNGQNASDRSPLESTKLVTGKMRSGHTRRRQHLKLRSRVKTLDEIYSFLQDISVKNDAVNVLEIGKSNTGLPIYTVKIHKQSFPVIATVVVEFGIHAREWASPGSAVYLIQKLLEEGGRLIEAVQWFIIPVLNPDGYNHSTFGHGMWKKNLGPTRRNGCPGVDLNRNFDVAWHIERSQAACSETFAGQVPFSEPETLAVRDLVESIGPQTIDAYVAVHSCAQSILHPYGYQEKAPDEEKLESLKEAAQKMADKMYKVRNQTYPVKQASSLGVSGGGSDDFMFQHFQIPLVFTLELGDISYFTARRCFHPNPLVMRYLTQECYAGLTALAEHVLNSKRTNIHSRIAPKSTRSSTRRISAEPEKLALLILPRLLPIY